MITETEIKELLDKHIELLNSAAEKDVHYARVVLLKEEPALEMYHTQGFAEDYEESYHEVMGNKEVVEPLVELTRRDVFPIGIMDNKNFLLIDYRDEKSSS